MKPVLQLLLLFYVSLFTSVISVCPRPPQELGSELSGGQAFFDPGTEVTLSCIQGFTSTGGSRKITCKRNGQWTERELKCSPKRCPVPEAPQNGNVDMDGIVYGSVITYSCNEGYILHGANSSTCLHMAQWSHPTPECTSSTCGLPPIPPFAKITFDKQFPDEVVEFGVGGTYHCLPPMVLFGNKRTVCQADGTWTEPPVCKLVTCPPPSAIKNGFLSFAEQREYDYKERVKYGCNEPYVLFGSPEVECGETGSWSKLPECKAPCSVGIQRGRIEYKGQKLWIEKFKPNLVRHLDKVNVFCLNEKENCGYPVTMQCNDGDMPTPRCYEEPGAVRYQTRSGGLPSEIKQCT